MGAMLANGGGGKLTGATAWGLADAEHPLTRPAGAHVFVTDPEKAALHKSQVSLKAMTTRDRVTPPPPPSKVSVAVAITVCEDGPQVRRQSLSPVRCVESSVCPLVSCCTSSRMVSCAGKCHALGAGVVPLTRAREKRQREDGVLSRVVCMRRPVGRIVVRCPRSAEEDLS